MPEFHPEELLEDSRIIEKEGILFCTAKNGQVLSDEFKGVKFNCCSDDIFLILLDFFGLKNVLDFDMMFKDSLGLCGYYEDIFERDFNEWLNRIKDIFVENYEWMKNNFKKCKENYFEMLKDFKDIRNVVN